MKFSQSKINALEPRDNVFMYNGLEKDTLLWSTLAQIIRLCFNNWNTLLLLKFTGVLIPCISHYISSYILETQQFFLIACEQYVISIFSNQSILHHFHIRSIISSNLRLQLYYGKLIAVYKIP